MKFWQRASSIGFEIPKLSEQELNKTFDNSQCKKLDGKLVANNILEQCKQLLDTQNITPCLAVILVGEDEASKVYVASKEKTFLSIGFKSQSYKMSSNLTSTENLIELINKLNNDNNIHGILVQLPLPKHINTEKVLNSIHYKKDVDGFLAQNLGNLLNSSFNNTYLSCTPFGIMVLLASYKINLNGLNALIVGRSNIVGKPMSLLLLSENATITVAHSQSRNLKDLCLNSDLIIVAVGKENMISSNYVNKSAIIIDVGINVNNNGKLSGDVSNDVIKQVQAYTPVPGGVGPLTIAMLCVNTAISAWSK